MVNNNPFIFTLDELKKIAVNYNGSKTFVSSMNDWQKYKNRYSRILAKAKSICNYFSKC